MIKVVIDTNIYISAIFWGGKPRQIIDLGRDAAILVLSSVDILREIRETLLIKFRLTPDDVERILLDLATFTIPIEVAQSIQAVEDDPDDNKFIECAVAGQADYVISGDRHLLRLKEYAGITILNAAEFLTRLSRSNEFLT